MTLVTRTAIRLSRRGGQNFRNARANAAFFSTAANQAQIVLPKFGSHSSKLNFRSQPGEPCRAYHGPSACVVGVDEDLADNSTDSCFLVVS